MSRDGVKVTSCGRNLKPLQDFAQIAVQYSEYFCPSPGEVEEEAIARGQIMAVTHSPIRFAVAFAFRSRVLRCFFKLATQHKVKQSLSD
jgi:hypothetical protein